MTKHESSFNAKDIVISFQESLNRRDLKLAKSYVSDNFRCINPLGTFDGAKAYFKAAEQWQKYNEESYVFDLKKIFINGNDVCVFNEVIAGSITFSACGWYHLEDHKISSLKLVYDPRPLLQKNQSPPLSRDRSQTD